MKKTTKPKRAKVRKYKKYTAPNIHGPAGAPKSEFLFGFYVTPTEKSRIETELLQIGLETAKTIAHEVDVSLGIEAKEAFCSVSSAEYADFFARAFKHLERFLALGGWRDKNAGVK